MKNHKWIYLKLSSIQLETSPGKREFAWKYPYLPTKGSNSFLKAGVPLSKVDSFRDTLEKHTFSLCDSSKLRQLIPFILDKEVQDIKRATEGKSVAVIFDSTTHVCEAMMVVLRYVDDDWQIKRQVYRLTLVAKLMTGEEVANQLIYSCSFYQAIHSSKPCGSIHARLGISQQCGHEDHFRSRQLHDRYWMFLSYTWSCWENMNTPILDEFTKHWISLFSHNLKVRLAWFFLSFVFCNKMVESLQSDSSDAQQIWWCVCFPEREYRLTCCYDQEDGWCTQQSSRVLKTEMELAMTQWPSMGTSKEWSQSCLHTWLLQKMYHHRLTPVNGGNTTVQIYQCGQERSEKLPLSNRRLQQQSVFASPKFVWQATRTILGRLYNCQWWCSTITETSLDKELHINFILHAT